MTVKPLNDAHLARMLAEYRRRIGRAEEDHLAPRPPAHPTDGDAE